jgi:hypothetical protein
MATFVQDAVVMLPRVAAWIDPEIAVPACRPARRVAVVIVTLRNALLWRRQVRSV